MKSTSFNHKILVEIFYVNITFVIHVVDEVTKYIAETWIPSISSDYLLKAKCMCWIDVLLGPPGMISHDT